MLLKKQEEAHTHTHTHTHTPPFGVFASGFSSAAATLLADERRTCHMIAYLGTHIQTCS
jgi:hypothetical protein